MRNITVLVIVGIFVFSVVLTGCGKLSSQEFEGWKDDYVEANDKAFSDLGNRTSSLESGSEQQKAELSQSIDDARDDAIAASQLGDVDTIKRAEEHTASENAKLRDELTETANTAAQEAKDSASRENNALRDRVTSLEQQTNSTAQSVSSLQSDVMSAQKDMEKAMADRPMNAATVSFSSGKVSLNDIAKNELNKAATAIKGQSDATVVVSGHADGSPVLSGKYRSNWDLSQARANAVAKYLKEQGVSNDIKTVARGHTMPVASVKTKAGRTANRRAEVVIYPPGTMAGM